MNLAQNSNASAASLEPGRSRSPCLRSDRKDFGSFYRLHERIVLGFTRKFCFSIQGKPILYFKGLSFGYFPANRYATDRVTGCGSVLFILFALVSSFADKSLCMLSSMYCDLLVFKKLHKTGRI